MTKMAFSPTIPTIMIPPTKLEMLSVIPVSRSAPKTPASTATEMMAVTRGARQSPNCSTLQPKVGARIGTIMNTMNAIDITRAIARP